MLWRHCRTKTTVLSVVSKQTNKGQNVGDVWDFIVGRRKTRVSKHAKKIRQNCLQSAYLAINAISCNSFFVDFPEIKMLSLKISVRQVRPSALHYAGAQWRIFRTSYDYYAKLVIVFLRIKGHLSVCILSVSNTMLRHNFLDCAAC